MTADIQKLHQEHYIKISRKNHKEEHILINYSINTLYKL